MQNRQTDAIVTGTRQQLCQVYEAEQALCRGTLFPELDKPLAGVRCTCSPCMTREHMNDFAAWELRLYLNMNPCDQQALNLYNCYCKELNGRGYACVDHCCDKDAAYNRNSNGCCDKDAAYNRNNNGCCDKDTAHNRSINGCCDKDAAYNRNNNGCCDKDAAYNRNNNGCCDNDISFARAARAAGKDNNGFIRVNGGWDKDDDLFARTRNVGNREQKKCCEQADNHCCEQDAQARWTWVEQPWPWEKCAACRKED